MRFWQGFFWRLAAQFLKRRDRIRPAITRDSRLWQQDCFRMSNIRPDFDQGLLSAFRHAKLEGPLIGTNSSDKTPIECSRVKVAQGFIISNDRFCRRSRTTTTRSIFSPSICRIGQLCPPSPRQPVVMDRRRGAHSAAS